MAKNANNEAEVSKLPTCPLRTWTLIIDDMETCRENETPFERCRFFINSEEAEEIRYFLNNEYAEKTGASNPAEYLGAIDGVALTRQTPDLPDIVKSLLMYRKLALATYSTLNQWKEKEGELR